MRDRTRVIFAVAVVLGGGCFVFFAIHPPKTVKHKVILRTPPPPAPEATWPWPKVAVSHPFKGVTRWFDDATEDGTTLELLRFDFKANPRLRFELYDQDEDDALPFNNQADYYDRGVGQVVKDLNGKGRGKVLAAWNGLFFAYDRRPGTPVHGFATHIGPVVVGGKAYHNVGQFRWTFGVKYAGGKPSFRTLFKPDLAEMARQLDFGSVGAQCLIRGGKPLRLPLFSADGSLPSRAMTSEDVGSVTGVDFLQTSRTSMGWSKDSRVFYLLVVNEPDSETASKMALRSGETPTGGWALADLQRFWEKLGVWGAVNSDGGSVTQLAWLRDDGKYELLPARIAVPNERLLFGPDFAGAPGGGTLLTFFVSAR